MLNDQSHGLHQDTGLSASWSYTTLLHIRMKMF